MEGMVQKRLVIWFVEAGVHTLSDGRLLQAGSMAASGNSWNTEAFAQEFTSPPVVLGQVGTANDPVAVTSRLRTVTTTSFQAQLEEEEGAANDHGEEVIFWVAIEPGVQGR